MPDLTREHLLWLFHPERAPQGANVGDVLTFEATEVGARWKAPGTGGVGTGVPGGSTGQVQVNLGGGNFGGISMTGDMTWNTTTGVASLTSGAVSYSEIQPVGSSVLLGNPTGIGGNVSEITLGAGMAFVGSTLTSPNQLITLTGGDVTGSGTSTIAATVTRIQGTPVVATPPSANDVLTFVGGSWRGQAPVSGIVNNGAINALAYYPAAGTTVDDLPVGAANTVLKGTGAAPSWGAVDLATAQVTGVLPPANHGTGTANTSTFLRGDGTWQPPPGGTINSGTTNQAAYYSGATALSSSSGLTLGATAISAMTMSLGGTTAVGDIFYAGAGGALTKLSAGANGNVLTSGGAATAPTWAPAGGGSLPSGGTVGQLLIKNSSTAGDAGWNSGGVVIGTPPDGVLGAGTLNTSGVIQVNMNTAALPAVTNPTMHLGAANGVGCTVFLDAFAASGSFRFRRANGNPTGLLTLATGDSIGTLGNVSGHDGTAYTGARAGINFIANGGWDSTHNGVYIDINTTPATGTGVIGPMHIASGVVVGNPTGGVATGTAYAAGDMGLGTVNAAVGFYVNGVPLGPGFCESVGWIAGANPNNAIIFANNTGRTLTITAITGTPEVLNGSAASVHVYVAASGSLLSSGNQVNNTALDLNVNAGTTQTLGVNATYAPLLNGSRLGIRQVGTPTFTSSVATVTVYLQ